MALQSLLFYVNSKVYYVSLDENRMLFMETGIEITHIHKPFTIGDIDMKKSLCIGIVLLLSFAFVFSAIAAETDLVSPQHMPGYGGWGPGYNNPGNSFMIGWMYLMLQFLFGGWGI